MIAALAQNNCGPQYAARARQNQAAAASSTACSATTMATPAAAAAVLGAQSGTYRTLCVRTCDGYYFPISFATTPARFPGGREDLPERCARRPRPMLYAYRNPGEDMNQAVSLERPALYGAAERVQVPHRVHARLQLQAAGADLGATR